MTGLDCTDAGRPTGVSAGGTTYVSAVTYADHGAVATMRLGGQRIRESLSYDPLRLQLTGIDVVRCADNSVTCATPEARWGAAYGYVTNATGGTGSGPNNNGNPRWQDIVVPGVGTPVRQNYTFDGWNRLQGFTEGALSETNCYDAHGNRAVVQRAGLTPMTPQVAACSKANVSAIFPGNRVAGGVTYDVSGGVAADGRSNLRYNAEDLVAKSWPAVGAATETVYEYDADGRRVVMVIGAARTTYVNDAGGALAAEYGGTVTAEMAGTSYVHVDALGSTRLLLDGDGAARRRVDYWPFGVEISTGETAWRTAGLGYAGDGEPRVKFTGKERDAETGLDYFEARYMSAAQGRFTSPDEFAGGPIDVFGGSPGSPGPLPYADIANPQSLNKYSYALNNPLRYVDPDGHEPDDTSTDNEPQQDSKPKKPKKKPTNQPVEPKPTLPDGRPAPPPVPVPGCPTCEWIWVPDTNGRNDRDGQWRPRGFPKTPGGIPSGGWDTGSRGGPGHWDIDDGNGERRRYYPDGRPMPDDIVHPPGWRPVYDRQRLVNTGVTAVGVGVGGYLIYRGVRMVPSLVFPPLWPTIVPNAMVP